MPRPAGRAPDYLIRAPAQLRALRSPVRQEILDALASAGPTSVADLARQLGRKPQALYYQLRALERVALVRRAGTRRNRRSDAALYAVPAPRLVLEYRLGSTAFTADMARILRSMLRLTERDYRRALGFRTARAEGAKRNILCSRTKARLTDRQVRRVNALIAALLEELAGAHGQRAGRLHALTLVIAPLEDET